MDECLKLADWDGFAKRAAESKKNGKLRGRGIGYFLEEAAVFNDRMVLRFDPSGMLTILAGTHSHGQGHDTVYAQMVHEWLGVPFENIRFVQGDTDAVPIGRGSYGSRSMHVGGNALKRAADAIIEKAKPMAAMMMEAAAGDIEFKDGIVPHRRHRPRAAAHRRRQGVSTARRCCRRNSTSVSKPPAHSPPSRRIIRTAATSARSRSIRRPAR